MRHVPCYLQQVPCFPSRHSDAICLQRTNEAPGLSWPPDAICFQRTNEASSPSWPPGAIMFPKDKIGPLFSRLPGAIPVPKEKTGPWPSRLLTNFRRNTCSKGQMRPMAIASPSRPPDASLFQRTKRAPGPTVLTASRRNPCIWGSRGGGGSISGGKGVGSLCGLPSEWKNAICVLDTRIHIRVRPHPDPDQDPRSRTHYSLLRTAKELQSVTESSEA